MTMFQKCMAIADRIYDISGRKIIITAQQVMMKIKSKEELDFYFDKLCKKGVNEE